uniref:NR LBD domain-containing protein n=1 Tax=Caenorhabditis tropicalis TaxID=1561998 RepID=A0A1I7UEZ8_9PELO
MADRNHNMTEYHIEPYTVFRNILDFFHFVVGHWQNGSRGTPEMREVHRLVVRIEELGREERSVRGLRNLKALQTALLHATLRLQIVMRG